MPSIHSVGSQGWGVGISWAPPSSLPRVLSARQAPLVWSLLTTGQCLVSPWILEPSLQVCLLFPVTCCCQDSSALCLYWCTLSRSHKVDEARCSWPSLPHLPTVPGFCHGATDISEARRPWGEDMFKVGQPSTVCAAGILWQPPCVEVRWSGHDIINRAQQELDSVSFHAPDVLLCQSPPLHVLPSCPASLLVLCFRDFPLHQAPTLPRSAFFQLNLAGQPRPRLPWAYVPSDASTE